MWHRINFQMIRQHLDCCGSRPISVHLNDMATTNETFSSWWWTRKIKYGQLLMYFCPRKNGLVEERVQLFSAIHYKLAKKSKKLSNFFQQHVSKQKCLAPDCTKHRLHWYCLNLDLKEMWLKKRTFEANSYWKKWSVNQITAIWK
jgi:hypothetical protein